MAYLKFGIHYTGSVARAEVVAYARRLESLGYDGFWATENARGREPLLVLATAAAVTNLDIGTGVLLLPFRHPTLLARELATLDRLSDGRLIVGVGVGGERAPDFDAYGIGRNERGARADESLELMRRLWSEHDVSHDGRFYKIDAATIDVRPVQQPRPRIWVGGRLGGQGKSRDAALKRTARYGDGWLPYLITPEQYATGLQRLEQYASEQGRDAATFAHAAQIYVAIYDTKNDALVAAMQTTARGYGLDEAQVERFCVIGTATDVIERLKQCAEAGVRYFVVQWSCLPSDVQRNIEVFAKEVMPALRDA